MRRDGLDLSDYLTHIAEAISRVQRYIANMDEATFVQPSSELVQDRVIRNLEVIGEAGNNIARRHPEFLASHPELQIGAAYEMRNRLAHGYFKVNLNVVWVTAWRDLPVMAAQIEAARVLMSAEEALLPPRPIADDRQDG